TAAGASASPAPQATGAVASASPASQAKGTIDVWNFPLTTDDANQLWKPLVEKFNKQDPQITVKAEVLPWGGRKEKMITAYAAGTPPDVAYVNSEDLSLFGANDALRELDSLIPKETWADFQEAVSGNGISWKGKRIMVPTLLEIDGRLVNTDMLSELGGDPAKPPVTWTDLLAFGAKAKEKGYFLTSWSLLSWDAEW